jgi:hypothetical protein
MRKSIALQFATLALAASAFHASAATQVGLADWCVNLNGDINTACNGGGGGGASGTGSISLSSFSTLLENGTNNNTLGSITVTLGAGANQYVGFYADYDVSYNTQGSFLDSASTHGAVTAGETYEVDDPNSSNIFNDFSGNSLNDKNNVGTPANKPPTVCCDVSFAMMFGGLGPGTVTFTVGIGAPASGFYIEQTNVVTGASIFLSGLYTPSGMMPPPPPGVPEPSTFFMGLGAMGLAWAFKRRRSAE